MGAAVRHASACPSTSQQISRFLALMLVAVLSLGLVHTNRAEANPRYAAYVIDANNGRVLFSRFGDEKRFPASLTKMMTAYMIFDAIESGRISKSSRIPISAKAAAEPPTKIGLRAGSTISVEDAILALVTRSANDIATAVGEFLGGSEANFTQQMTAKARQIGMASTTFRNAHGLPNSGQTTTARDMAILGIALREHFPQHSHYFSARQAVINSTRYNNHNRVLGRVNGADGIKTGFIRASGFNLVSSVQADGRSIVAVVMGGQSAASRDDHMVALIREYLPKGSRGKSGPLLPGRQGGGSAPLIASAAQGLPSSVPTPDFRPVAEANAPAPATRQPQIAASAYASTANAASVPSLAAATPVPSVPVGSAEEAIAQGSVDPVTTAAVPASGWVVQVAASPSEVEARGVLENIASRAADVLGNAQGFTQTHQANGTTYHRARFGGFSSSEEAWNACNGLKRKKIDCYAVQL